jgi:hypothetical protein
MPQHDLVVLEDLLLLLLGGAVENGASEDRWMVAPGCDE